MLIDLLTLVAFGLFLLYRAEYDRFVREISLHYFLFIACFCLLLIR